MEPPVSVIPKAFDLLIVMVAESGQSLFKDKLMEAVWRCVSVGKETLR